MNASLACWGNGLSFPMPRKSILSKLRYFALLGLVLVVFLPLRAQEWTRFRGPNGSGIGELSYLPDEIFPADYRWVVSLEGVGHSSPVLWGRKLFLTTSAEDADGTPMRRVLCFDSENGALLWSWLDPLEAHNLHRFNNFASSTPTVDAERVYLVWGSGDTTQALALSHEGELLWRKSWPDFSSDHGQGSSPVLAGGVLVFHTDSSDQYKSHVIGLSPETGEVIWNLERTTPETDQKHFTAYNTPITVEHGGIETVVALQSNDGWKGLDPRNGRVVWSAPGGYSFRSVSSVTGGGGLLFASFGSGGAGKQATALEVGSGEPTVLYSLGLRDGLSYVTTPLVHEGNLYLWADGGILTCRDLRTGEEKFRERIGGNYYSSPVLADGKILCGSLHGEVIVVRASDEFEVLGRSQLDGGIHATPAIANNALFIRTETHLISISGERKQARRADGAMSVQGSVRELFFAR